MSTTATYTSLQTDSLLSVTLDFSVLKENFTIMNQFIKQFGQFQKKFSQVQKSQKSLTDNLSSFKLSTQSQLQTVTQMLQSRNGISSTKANQQKQQLNQIRKSIKQLKQFMTESTRQQHQAQIIRQQQQQTINKKLSSGILQLQTNHNITTSTIQALTTQLTSLQQSTAKKSQLSELSFRLSQLQTNLQQSKGQIQQLGRVLKQSKVQEFSWMIKQIDQRVSKEIEEMKVKFNLKANTSDLMKLEEMILGVVEYGFESCGKMMANKIETKKALMFLEKRINSLLVMTLGEEEGQREALITAKQLKCISCTKDLGQLQGKLDRTKNWSVFPVKQNHIKQKYAGFGAGFQSIIESTVTKKGGEIKYDQKGRMLQPFNLTGTIQGSLLKSSKSQHKIQSQSHSKNLTSTSPSKHSLKYQTSFMQQFGRDSALGEFNVAEQYYARFKGLESYVIGQGKTFVVDDSKRGTPVKEK